MLPFYNKLAKYLSFPLMALKLYHVVDHIQVISEKSLTSENNSKVQASLLTVHVVQMKFKRSLSYMIFHESMLDYLLILN